MRRADRLFEIVQQLRGDRLVTAQKIAERLEVSVRTIYRDIRDLQTAGVPIDGEAGVGYLLRPGFQLPPLMFTLGEIEALMVGARMVEAWAGRELARSASEAMVKIAAVAPADRMRAAGRVAIFAPGYRFDESLRTRFDLFVRSIDEKRKASFAYGDAVGAASIRIVRPLALHFWGGVWTVAAWCELRTDFRTFRLDRVGDLALTDDRFVAEPGRALEDYMARVTADRAK
ncbi:MAG: YafY family transcriptional regulator [Rhizobiales bacterium]|nr:YafY family transcriptional regulator [Hyphomicrobiales bacterium]MBN9010242.1 YafY family transcriptional regulator [Hyphomicrobiales bacterium]